MLTIKNTEVFGLERAIRASGNPMTIGEINTKVDKSDYDYYGYGVEDKEFKRAYKLGSARSGSGHDNFLKGIQVTFDILYPQYWTPESQRYTWWNIISSQSKMHRLTAMGKDEKFEGMFNKYVDERVIKISKELIDEYNSLYTNKMTPDKETQYTAFMKCVSNLPMGFEMWETVQCSYLQLKTIYFQRRNHKLQEDWGAFCDWCESLPMFKELVGIKQ